MTLEADARELLQLTKRDPERIQKALRSVEAAQGGEYARQLRNEMRRLWREQR